MIIGILQYGAVFLLLALAQLSKKDILQKIVISILWSICKVKFVFFVFDFYVNTYLLLQQISI